MNSQVNEWADLWSASPVRRFPGARLVESPMGPAVVAAGESREADEWFSAVDAFARLDSVLDSDDVAAAVLSFVQDVGWLDLCQHGRPDTHVGGGVACEPLSADEQGAVAVRDVVRMVEGLRSAEDLSRRVRLGQKWNSHGYLSLQTWPGPARINRAAVTDASVGREYLARWLTTLMRECDIRPLVTWDVGRQPQVTYEVDGLVGAVVVELSRRMMQPTAERPLFRCDFCGQPVNRMRAPKPGESVSCGSEACTRARKALNSRARRNSQKEAQHG